VTLAQAACRLADVLPTRSEAGAVERKSGASPDLSNFVWAAGHGAEPPRLRLRSSVAQPLLHLLLWFASPPLDTRTRIMSLIKQSRVSVALRDT